jgi:prolycopene isomerase
MYTGGEEARQRFVEKVTELFPHEGKEIRAFFDKLLKIYEQADYATFLGTGLKDVARILLKCPTLVQTMGKTIGPFVDDYAKDPKLKAVLSINSTCAFLPPSRMSLLGIVMLMLEGVLSNLPVKGGSQAVSDAFAKSVREGGGEIMLGRLVEKILVENGRACGVRIVNSPLAISEGKVSESEKGEEIRGKYVVSNAAARQTFYKLIGADKVDSKFLQGLGRLEPCAPFCALFLGLDMDLKEMGITPAIHIYSPSYDVEGLFENLESKMVNEQGPEPPFRLHLATITDPTSAPKGKTAFLMHYVPAPSTGWDNPEWEKKLVDLMIVRAERVIPDLSKRIAYQEFWSPQTVNKYALSGEDASMGWALTPGQLGARRLAQETPIKNLLLCGHWTRPAVGVSSVVASGLQAAKMILKREGVEEPLADLGIRKGIVIR